MLISLSLNPYNKDLKSSLLASAATDDETQE
jgi:hypothetical protein